MKFRSASALLLASALSAAALPPPDFTVRVSSFDDLAALGSGIALTTELCSAADALSFVEMAKGEAAKWGEFRTGEPICLAGWGDLSNPEDPDFSCVIGFPATKPADGLPESLDKETVSLVGSGDNAYYADSEDDDGSGFVYRGNYGFILSSTNLLSADFAAIAATPASFKGCPIEFFVPNVKKFMPAPDEMAKTLENMADDLGEDNAGLLKVLVNVQKMSTKLSSGMESARMGMGFDPVKGLFFVVDEKLTPGSEAAAFYCTDKTLDPAKIGPAPKNAFFHYASVGCTEPQKKWLSEILRDFGAQVVSKIPDEKIAARLGKVLDLEAVVATIGGGEGFFAKDADGHVAISSSAKLTDAAPYRTWLRETVSLVRDLLELPEDSTRLRLTEGGFACNLEPAAQVQALADDVPPAVGDVLNMLLGAKWSLKEEIKADGTARAIGMAEGSSLPKDDSFDYIALAKEFNQVFPDAPVTALAGGSCVAAIRDLILPPVEALRATGVPIPPFTLTLPADAGISFAGSAANGFVRQVAFVSVGELKGFAAIVKAGVEGWQQSMMNDMMMNTEDGEDFDPWADEEADDEGSNEAE